ncbi:MAG: hypothetical protein F2667_10240 [Actinobacteria bacterium]|uniref:Unannotated protein n=1 Tax=freshwater metagenome TaxID=449393 RepID=A0A6J6R9R8_9ZZZZ|nr:hypothetical protein [Actinomycetota bacterium]
MSNAPDPTDARASRRWLVAAAGLAAAAAIVTVSVVAQRGDDATPAADPESSSSPSSASPTPTAPTGPTRPAGPSDSPVGIDYLEGTTWVRADGARVDLATAYDGGTVLGDDLIGVHTDARGRQLFDVVGPDGSVTETVPFLTGLAVNEEHTTIAYLEPDGDLMTMWDPRTGDEGRVRMARDLPSDVSPVSVLGGPSCYEATPHYGCAVVYNFGDGETPPRSVSSHGIDDEVVFVGDPPLQVADATADGVLVVTESYTDLGSCNGVYDPRGARGPRYDYETCDYFLLDIAPDGAHVAATHAYLDGPGNGFVAVLDDAGDEVARLTPQGGVTVEQAWEDDDSVLVTVNDGDGWTMWRLGVDGSATRVLGPSPAGDDVTPGYRLLGGY